MQLLLQYIFRIMSGNAKFLIVFFVALIAGFLTYFKYMQDKHLHNTPLIGPDGHKVGAFSFTNQDGQIITDKTVEGKIKVVEYFFTTCKGICPKMNENMARVYANFKGNKNVVILSHTVDPKTDTLAQMKNYSLKFEANSSQWHFLTGSKEDLYRKAINDYLVTAADSSEKNILPTFIHTERFVLVDKWGRIRGRFYDGTNDGDVNQLIGDIKQLIKEMEDPEYNPEAHQKKNINMP
jgi:protein SCO1